MISPAEHAHLTSVVHHVGEVLLSLWPGKSGGSQQLRAESKSDGSIVTQADLRANEMLMAALKGLFPHDAILSEESPAVVAELLKSHRTWVIDPLDGTRSFVEGRDDFSILIALCKDFVPVYGIMYFPAREQLVTVCQGAPSLCDGVALQVSESKELTPQRVYIRNFECKRPELASPMMDSGAALLKVAQGELDGAIIRMTTHREWDIAAPMAVIEGAGGMVTDQTGVRPSLGRGSIGFEYLIASNGRIHQQLQDLI